jgi:hypothetical protein
VTEYEWRSWEYHAAEVDVVTGATAGALTTGDGRNDGTERLYVSDNDSGSVYEIEWTVE